MALCWKRVRILSMAWIKLWHSPLDILVLYILMSGAQKGDWFWVCVCNGFVLCYLDVCLHSRFCVCEWKRKRLLIWQAVSVVWHALSLVMWDYWNNSLVFSALLQTVPASTALFLPWWLVFADHLCCREEGQIEKFRWKYSCCMLCLSVSCATTLNRND